MMPRIISSRRFAGSASALADLVLMYRAGSRSEARRYRVDEALLGSIANVFQVRSVPKVNTRWGHEAKVTSVALLENPMRLEQMRRDRILMDAPFVRRSMLGRNNVTPFWYRLYDLVLKMNPSREIRRQLLPFAPERL